MTFLSDATSWAALVGVASPLLIAAVAQPQWSKTARQVVSVLAASVLGVGTCLAEAGRGHRLLLPAEEPAPPVARPAPGRRADRSPAGPPASPAPWPGPSSRWPPTPKAGTRLNRARIAAAMRGAGRTRLIDRTAAEIHAEIHGPRRHLHLPDRVTDAHGHRALALLGVLNAHCDAVDQLSTAAVEAFREHPAYKPITSLPGLGETLGARLLGEIGDVPGRFANARQFRSYLGFAPSPGRPAPPATSTPAATPPHASWPPGGCVHCQRSPATHRHGRTTVAGDRNRAALRNLCNRLAGCLNHCLSHGVLYDADAAFGREAVEEPA